MSLRTLLLEISLLFCLGNCWADHVTYWRAPIGAQPTVWTGVENGSLCVHAAVPSWQQLDTWMLAWRGFRTVCRGDFSPLYLCRRRLVLRGRRVRNL